MKFNEAQVLLQSVHALISDLMQHQPTSQSLSYTHLYFDWIFIELLESNNVGPCWKWGSFKQQITCSCQILVVSLPNKDQEPSHTEVYFKNAIIIRKKKTPWLPELTSRPNEYDCTWRKAWAILWALHSRNCLGILACTATGTLLQAGVGCWLIVCTLHPPSESSSFTRAAHFAQLLSNCTMDFLLNQDLSASALSFFYAPLENFDPSYQLYP